MGNSEIVQLLVKVMLTTFVLMAVIMICCVITPKLAKWIDSHRRPTQDGGTDSVRAENETPAPEGLRAFAEAAPSALRPDPLPLYLNPPVRAD